MVLFAIIKSILTNSWGWSIKDEKSPLGIIKTTLIAGILIQASWFLLAALIDISTVATYAVWGLPLSVLKDTDIGKQKILSVNSSIDLNKFDLLNKEWDFSIWYSTTYNGKELKISPCKVAYSYVIWREQWDPKFRNVDTFSWDNLYKDYEVCVLFGSKLVMRKEDALMTWITALSWITADYQHDKQWYKTMMTALLNHTGWQNDHMTWELIDAVNLSSWSAEWIQKWAALFSGSTSMTIGQLINKSKWFVWPLVTIYASLLNFTQLTDSNTSSIWETSGIFIIKACVALALFFPLVALALVLIARVGILRLYIVASPFIVIKESFKNFLKIESLDKYLSIKALMGIVFAPVVTVAALSISLIFMTALVNGFKSPDTSDLRYSNIGLEKMDAGEWRDAVAIQGGMWEIEFTKLPWWEAMDRFSRLMVNFFAVGLMWMIFFTAIKANAIWEKVGARVQEFWGNVFKTLPILPIGEGGAWVGVGSAFNVANRMPETRVSQRNSAGEAQATEWMQQWAEAQKAIETGKLNETQITWAIWVLSKAATQEEAKTLLNTYLTDQKITASIATVGVTNGLPFYEEIKKEKDGIKQKQLITNFNNAFGVGSYEKIATEHATAKIKDLITNAKITENMTVDEIKENIKHNISWDDWLVLKEHIKEYFDNNTTTPYTQTIWNKTLTISKKAGTDDEFDITFIQTATK